MKQIARITTLLPLAALLFSPKLCLGAGDILLSGTVLTESTQPISGAKVCLKRNDVITHAARTNPLGRFKITDDSNSTVAGHTAAFVPGVSFNGSALTIVLDASCPVKVCVYNIGGRKRFELDAGVCDAGIKKIVLPTHELDCGMHIIVVDRGGHRSVLKRLFADRHHAGGGDFREERGNGTAVSSWFALTGDTLVITADGFVPKRHPAASLIDSTIVITLSAIHYDNVTPSYPVITVKGGSGNVTTYGSVSDPECSEGGACNYGSTKILYYAAINVHQVPGDFLGNWQNGRACGRCARVRVLTKDGWRVTVVRVTDKCADTYGGIDLGGAPARDCMGTQPGRYSGDWEWVNCDEGDSVSDGPPSLYVKEGSNAGWSIIHARNGPGGVTAIRACKVGTANWESFAWATEAENFFRVPVLILQDNGDWDIVIDWDIGSSSSSVRLPGSALAEAGKSYPLR